MMKRKKHLNRQFWITLFCLAALSGTIQADWPEFRGMGRKQFSKMRSPVVVDGRRCLDAQKVEASGARYFGVGFGQASDR